MPIVLARIDDRLVHGQVVEGWLRVIKASYIIVVSDDVAKDRLQQTLLTIAVPKNVKIECLSIEDSAKRLLSAHLDNEMILLLFSTPDDTLRLLKSGVKLTSINVGGMHYVEGKKQILRTLSVNKKDVDTLTEISNMNIELEGRVLPNDERNNIMEVLKAEFINTTKENHE
ncbi:MAG: PTS sugar transporter subunit IIB [Elusimicrobia bacterium]|nr:PTS sugar transporter subunit IIB [Candidatus Liberimonas magnetica]